VFARPDTAALGRLVEMVDAGTLRVMAAGEFALKDAAAAQAALQARSHGPGKIVLIPEGAQRPAPRR
jgi:NADPH:quinone reductase-like Zn-dependent oxidoreductase